jgi:hypothetical protein
MMSSITIGSYDDFDILIDAGVLNEDDVNALFGSLPADRSGFDIVVDIDQDTGLGTFSSITVDGSPDVVAAGAGLIVGQIIALTVETLPYWLPYLTQALTLLGKGLLVEEAVEFITGTGGFTDIDDAIQAWLSSVTGGFVGPPSSLAGGRLPSLQDLGLVDGNGAATKPVGSSANGFTVKSITVYVRGQRSSKLVWHKPKRMFTPAERMAAALGRREQKVSDKKYWGKKNTASYKRGKKHGAENQRKEMLMYGRGTSAVSIG